MFYIYKSLKTALAPVAQILLTGKSAEVQTSELQIQKILERILNRPAMLSRWEGSLLVKTKPKTVEAMVTASLRRFLPRPYFASTSEPEIFTARYFSTVEVEHDS